MTTTATTTQTPAQTTCQCCGRAVKTTKNGEIAHHGHKISGGMGSKSRPCMGSSELPYEVTCDYLPTAIEHTNKKIAAATSEKEINFYQDEIARFQDRIAKWVAPATLTASV